MKISETVITVLVTLFAVLPFIWFTYLGKKAGNKNKHIIKDLLRNEQMKFDTSEMWNHHFIGINEVQKQLLFIKLGTNNHQIDKIDLNDVKSCHIDKITRDYKIDKKEAYELQSLNLELIFASNKPKLILNFYDINDKLSEEFEMNRAEKWQKAILSHIQKMKIESVAAA